MGNWNDFFCVSNKDKRWPDAFLSGMAIGERDIVIDNGFQRYLETVKQAFSPADFPRGRYSLVVRQEDKLLAASDPFGQQALFYYYEPCSKSWAISNSYQLLKQRLEKLGVPLTADLGAAASFFIDGPTGAQLNANATPIREIRAVPLAHYVVVDLKAGTLLLTDSGLSDLMHEIYPRGSRAYRDAMVEWVSTWSGVVRALCEQSGYQFQSDLSGGTDTRTMFALYLAAGLNLSNIQFVSNTRADTDYAVAQQVSETFGFGLNERRMVPSVKLSLKDTLRHWRFGNFGVYRPLYLNSVSFKSERIKVHGGGGGCLKRLFSKKATAQVSRIRKLYRGPKPLLDAVIENYKSGYDELGCSMKDASAMDQHYWHFRNRYHNGRGAFRDFSGRLITPLCDPFIQPMKEREVWQRESQSRFAVDLYAGVDERLGLLPFDAEYKNLTRQDLAQSPLYGLMSGGGNIARSFRVFDESRPVEETSEPAAKPGQVVNRLIRQLEKARETSSLASYFPDEFYASAVEACRSGGSITKESRDLIALLYFLDVG